MTRLQKIEAAIRVATDRKVLHTLYKAQMLEWIRFGFPKIGSFPEV